MTDGLRVAFTISQRVAFNPVHLAPQIEPLLSKRAQQVPHGIPLQLQQIPDAEPPQARTRTRANTPSVLKLRRREALAPIAEIVGCACDRVAVVRLAPGIQVLLQALDLALDQREAFRRDEVAMLGNQPLRKLVERLCFFDECSTHCVNIGSSGARFQHAPIATDHHD